MFNKLNALLLVVDNFENSLSFYKDKLELKVIVLDLGNKFAEFEIENIRFEIAEKSKINLELLQFVKFI